MKIPVKEWKNYSAQEKNRLLRRSEEDISQVMPAVQKILERVQHGGDGALRECTKEFDKVDLGDLPLRVQPQEIQAAYGLLSAEVLGALKYSIDNVKKYHKSQIPEAMSMVEVRPGLLAGERATSIESCGLYVPRGRGSFPSMTYMLAVPAHLAGVERIVMVTPPNSDGSVDPACLVAADLCGVHEIYRVGGAQAIAALTWGTETLLPVLKIVGPGSMFVSAAKRLLAHVVDVGLPAGPSESAILADESSDPWITALDLLVEAEHGADSSAILVTPSLSLAQKVAQHLEAEVELLTPPRRGFVEAVFSGYGGIILVPTLEEGAQLINDYAPEHLIVRTTHDWSTLSLIRNAGEIILGSQVPFSAANYATGPNAVLPTGGKAKTWSPVSVRDFMKFSSVITADAKGYQDFAPHVVALSHYEGFQTHAHAITKRKH